MWANQFEANDEGRISLALDLNIYTLSTIVVVFLLFLIVRVSMKNKWSLVFNILTFIVAALLLFGINYLDFKYKIRFD
jgi:hypothetical protein